MASQFSGNNWLAITDIKSNFTGRTKYFILKHMSKKQVSEALEQFNVKELIGPMSMMLLNEKIQELDQKRQHRMEEFCTISKTPTLDHRNWSNYYFRRNLLFTLSQIY
jgi:hypothetical protein